MNKYNFAENKPGFKLTNSKLFYYFKHLPKIIGFEAAVWLSGLFYLAFIHSPGSTHFSICIIKYLGFDFCPGCGLGNSVSYIFHGDIYNSIITHPLGLFALIILAARIIYLIKNNWRRYDKYFTSDALPSG